MGGARVNSLNKVLLKHHLHSNTLWCVVGGGGKADDKAGDLKDDCGGGIADVDGVPYPAIS